jgi:hypothetical protein
VRRRASRYQYLIAVLTAEIVRRRVEDRVTCQRLDLVLCLLQIGADKVGHRPLLGRIRLRRRGGVLASIRTNYLQGITALIA